MVKIVVDDHPITGSVYYDSVTDGINTGTAFTGTDNTQAFQQALNYAASVRRPLYVPPGQYRFAPIATNGAMLTLPGYVWIVGPGAVFLIDEDPTIVGQSARDFMRSQTWESSAARDLNEICRIEGLTFQGRWTHAPEAVQANAYKGMHFLTVSNYKEVVLDDIRAFDCRGNFSRSAYNDRVTVKNCRFERIVSDCVRFISSNYVSVTGCYIANTGDNSIALPATPKSGNFPYVRSPTRTHIEVIGNRIVGAVTPLVMAAHTTIFANNILQRCGGGLGFGLEGSAAPEGNSPSTAVIISNNILEDTLQRYINSEFPGQTRLLASLTLGGSIVTDHTSSVFPGDYDPGTGTVLQAWGEDNAADPPYGFMWTSYNFAPVLEDDGFFKEPDPPPAPDTFDTLVLESSAGTFNIQVTNNIIARTLPAVDAYSDWGFGQMWTAIGYSDPPITEDTWRLSGISLYSDLRNVLVAGNTIFGNRKGAGIVFASPDSIEQLTDQWYQGVVVRGNTIVDCDLGITTSRGGDGSGDPLTNGDVTIEDNHFDLDPYHKSAFRTTPINGTWKAAVGGDQRTSDAPVGVNMRGHRGWVIRNNSFRNTLFTIGPAQSNALAQAHLENNLCVCDPAGVGDLTTNKGVGDVPPSSAGFKFLIVNSDPTSVDWRKLKNTCPQQASLQPSTGTWVAGTFVANSAPAVAAGKVLLGWTRLTTGTAHVAGTDWSPLYCTVT